MEKKKKVGAGGRRKKRLSLQSVVGGGEAAERAERPGRLCLLTLQEVTRRHILELMYAVLRRKRSQRRECGGGRGSGSRREEKLKRVIRHASPPCKSDVHI